MMKLIPFLTAIVTLNASAADPICTSQYVKNILTFEKIMPISNNDMELIRKDLKEKLASVCEDSSTSSYAKIDEMAFACSMAVNKRIQSEEVQKLIQTECYLANKSSIAFIEGTKISTKCEKEESISNLSKKVEKINSELEGSSKASSKNDNAPK